MDVRVVELIEFPPTEFTISNIFRGSFWALESIIFSWYFCRMKKYFILCLIQKLFLKRPGISRPDWTELVLTWSNRFVDSEWFLLVDIFCTVLLLVLLQSAIRSAINGRFSGLVWKQPSIIFRSPSVIKQPTSNWRYSPLFTFCRVSLTYHVRIFRSFSIFWPCHWLLRMEIGQLNMNIKVFQVRKYQMGMKLVDIGRFLAMRTLANNDPMVLEYLLESLVHFQKNQV